MNLPSNNINFLRDVPSNIKVDLTSGWRHHYFDESLLDLSTFIKLIGDDKIYLLIPLFAGSISLQTATLILSEPFLVNNKSTSILIAKLVLNQWESSGFKVNEASSVYLGFEFKEVWFSDK